MIADRDIWRAANLLIREHGADAEIVAARRADDMRNAATTTGNRSGFGSGGWLSKCRPHPWASRTDGVLAAFRDRVGYLFRR
jgi:hypothetical protein